MLYPIELQLRDGRREEARFGNTAQAIFLKNKAARFPPLPSGPPRACPARGTRSNGRLKSAFPRPTFPCFTVATQPNVSSAGADVSALSFEDAMDRLEAIVDAMESGEVPLAELLARFEEGGRLLTHCEQRLKTAELKIEQLKRRKDGSSFLEGFVPSERPETGAPSS